MAAPIRLKFGVDESTPHVKFHHHTEWGWGIRPKIVNCTKFEKYKRPAGVYPLRHSYGMSEFVGSSLTNVMGV